MRLLASLVVVVLLGGPLPRAWTQAQAVSAKSPDGKLIATANDKTIHVSSNNKRVMQIAGSMATIISLAYSPDGKILASADKNDTIHLFEGATGKLLRTIQTAPGTIKVSFSANGKLLEAKTPTQTKKYDLATGKETN